MANNYDGDITLSVNLTPGDVKSTANSLRKEIDNIFSSNAGKELSATFKSLQTNMDKSSKKAGELLTKLNDLENKSVPTKDFEALEKELEKLYGQLGSLSERKQKFLATGGKVNSRTFLGIEYDFNRINDEINSTYQQMEALRKAGNAGILGEDTQEYGNLVSELNQVNNQMTIYTQRAHEAAQANSPERWEKFRSVLSTIGSVLLTVASAVANVAGKIAHLAISIGKLAFSKAISGLKSIASHSASAARNLAKMASSGIRNGIKKLISSISDLGKHTKKSNNIFEGGFKTLLRYGFGIRSVYFLFRKLRKALGEGLQNLVQYSDPFNKKISEFMASLLLLKNTFATAFKPIIDVVIPILVAFMNAMADAVTRVGMLIASLTGQKSFIKAKKVQLDYAKSLDKSAKSAKKDEKEEKKRAKTLAGFDDIEILKSDEKKKKEDEDDETPSPEDMFEKVPIENKLKDLAEKIKKAWNIEDGFEGLGKRLAKKIEEELKKIPWKAIKKAAAKIGKKIAEFINGAITSKGLAKALGEALAEGINTFLNGIASFLKKLDWAKLGKFIADMMNAAIKKIDRKLLAQALADLINGIFKALESWSANFDFKELGRAIAYVLKNTLDNIDWDTAKQAAANIGKGLADLLNEVITPDVFESVGRTIAEALNTAITFAYRFLSNIKWDQWGEAVATGLTTFFNTFNWMGLGITLAEFVNGMATLIGTAIGDIDWGDAVSKFAQGLMSYMNHIQWDNLKKAAGNMGTGLADAINALMTEEVLGKVGEHIAEIFNTRIEGIYQAVTKIKWSDVGKNFATGFTNYINTFDFTKAGLTLNAFANGVLDMFKSALENIKWIEVGQKIGEFLEKIEWTTILQKTFTLLGEAFGAIGAIILGALGDIPKQITEYFNEKSEEYGGNIAAGIFMGVIGWIADIGSWIKKNILDPFVEGVKKIFGIASPAKNPDIVSLGGYIIEGVFNGIIEWIKGIKEWIKKNVFDKFVDALQSLGQKGEQVVEIGVSLVKKGWDTLKSFVEKGDNAVTAAVSLVKKGWTSIKEFVGNKVETAISLVKKGWSSISSFVGSKVEAAVTLIKSGWSTISSFVGTAVKATVSLVKSGWSSISSFVGNAVKVTVALAKSGWSNIKSFVGNAVSVSISLIRKGWTSLSRFVGNVVSVGVSLVKKGWFTLSRFIGSAVSVGVSLIKSGWRSISDFVGTSVRVGISLFKSGWRSISSFVGNAVSVGISLFKSGWTSIKSFFGLSSGGIVGANGGVNMFASGGVIYSNLLKSIPKYANGAMPTHGTMFVAGENGTEAVGRIGSRTEVLNRSQMASVMYSAVVNGTLTLMSTITNYITRSTNAIISNIGTLIYQLDTIHGQMSQLADFGNLINTNIADIVTGKIIPSAMNNNNASENTLNKILTMLQYYQNNVVTKDELYDTLQTMFERHMNIGFYIGDEQIARHANAGNDKLNYRFSPVRR